MGCMSIEKINSLGQYIIAINKILERAHRFNPDVFWFRGVNSCELSLLPKYFRKIDDAWHNPLFLAQYENEVLERFKKIAVSYVRNISFDDHAIWLAYAQHFGAPTRLLDWTSNALVALYFTLEYNSDKDGAVWLLDTSAYGKFTIGKSEYLKQYIKTKKSPTRGELISNIINDDIKNNSDNCFEYPVTFVPYYIDERMRAQGSQFMLWGKWKIPLEEMNDVVINIYDNELHSNTNNIIINDNEKYNNFLYKIIINASSKKQIEKELMYCGIYNYTIFPGLDGIGKSLENIYRYDQDRYIDELI